ncbi:MAG: DNA mismatch repair endonuclease MutL [Blastocatellia bacterium]|nr:DNA mismatch repair endonuclease MutL [Blastocatellia bacterium]
MSKIRLLSDIVANQIAAGEVVERPASVAKELLENSLDAGGMRLEIEIEQGGKNLLRVRDDGEGMTRDDTLLAFERHATSKIRTVTDLNSITTFGFRGEALASIASVARITLCSKLRDEIAGTELEIEGGRIKHVRDSAWPGGTEITIRDLFFNIPARRKFLKSEATESFHITNLVTHYALANPDKSFILKNNGRETINVSPVTDLGDRAYQLFGEKLLGELVKVDYEHNGMTVRGYVSRPQEQRASRDAQYLFVNGRYVKDRLIGRAVTEAYRNILPPGFFPSVMLFVELSPEEVDVNVHPQKTEVRFRHSSLVHDTVRDGVKLALGVVKPFAHFPGLQEPLHPPASLPLEGGSSPLQPEPETGQPAAPATDFKAAFAALDRNFKAEFQPAERLSAEHHPQPSVLSSQPLPEPRLGPAQSSPSPPQETQPAPFFLTQPKIDPSVAEVAERFVRAAGSGAKAGRGVCAGYRRARSEVRDFIPESRELRSDVRILGQMHDSYIIATDARGLLLIDQHVAHERVLFEQHLRRLMNRTVVSQALLIPETLDLTPAQGAAFAAVNADLEANGFDVMQLSARTIALRALPAELDAEEARTLLLELLDVVEAENRSLALEYFQREIAAGLACRAAIKVNMILNMEKMTWLIDELMKTENPTNCPHGRPVLLRFDMHEIERGFKRI